MKERVIIDTNVIFDAILAGVTDNNRCRQAARAYDMAMERYEPVVNAAMVREINRVIMDPRLKHVAPKAMRQQFLDDFYERSAYVKSGKSTLPHCDDPDDVPLLDAATQGAAKYLLTSDARHLLPIQAIGETLIVSPRQFIGIEAPKPVIAVTNQRDLLDRGVVGDTVILSERQATLLSQQISSENLDVRTLVGPPRRNGKPLKELVVTDNADILSLPKTGSIYPLSRRNYDELKPKIEANPTIFAYQTSPVKKSDKHTPKPKAKPAISRGKPGNSAPGT